MSELDRQAPTTGEQTSPIRDWHAHVYFDHASRDAARALRDEIVAELAGRLAMGRFHEQPVGPHPIGSYQLSITPGDFADVVGWLALHRGGLDVFVHPNTGDDLRDHRDHAIWIGRSYALNLAALGG